MKKRITFFVLLHVCFWIFNVWREYCDCTPMVFTIMVHIFVASTFYLNYFLLIPWFFRANKVMDYFLWALVFLGVLALMGLLSYYLFTDFYRYKQKEFIHVIGGSVYLGFYYGGVSTAFRLAYDLAVNEEQNRKLALQKTNTQIQLMKSNLNLPFIVETLALLEEIGREDPGRVKEPLLELSNVLRYGTYEATYEQVELEKELFALEEYVALVNRMENNYRLRLITVDVREDLKTVPNLLIKIVSYWREQVGVYLTGEQVIEITSEESTIRMNLPIVNSFDFKELLGHYPEISSSRFTTVYKLLPGLLLVQINSLKHEYQLSGYR